MNLAATSVNDESNLMLPIEFTMTRAATILTCTTGILSFLSSLFILNIVRMSNQKLTTTYHRIMAFMSVFDMMASVSMALTTLPMPSDDMLRFDGPMLGNHLTCQTQGYFVVLGLIGGMSLYMCLSWYFVCRITLRMDLFKIRKRFEPAIYIYATVLAFFLSSYMLSNDLINVIPRASFCVIGPMRTNCTYTADGEYYSCEVQKSTVPFEQIKFFILGLNIVMILVAMMIIIWTILRKNRDIKRVMDENRLQSDYELDTSELRYSRVLVIQALMYIFAFIMTWFFTFTSNVIDEDQPLPKVILVLKSIFFPMQGFWNLIIFVYDKAYLVYQSDTYEGFWKTITIILFHPAKAPDIILPSTFMDHDHADDNADNEEVAGNIEISADSHKSDVDTETMEPGRGSNSLDSSPLDTLSTPSSNFELSGDSKISGESSSVGVIRRDGVEYVGYENLRFYLDNSGLRRTGAVEDRREGRAGMQSTISIESPSGLVGDSDVSIGTIDV
jgi:hypothetical protein